MRLDYSSYESGFTILKSPNGEKLLAATQQWKLDGPCMIIQNTVRGTETVYMDHIHISPEVLEKSYNFSETLMAIVEEGEGEHLHNAVIID